MTSVWKQSLRFKRVARAGAIALMLQGGGACSSAHQPTPSDATVPSDAASDEDRSDSASDTGAPALTCQDLRLCVAAGGSPTSCAARGSPEAQALFQTLLDCLAGPCSGLLLACVCRETCQQPDGFCLDETDACVGASGTAVDAVCGQYCGG